MATAVVSPIMGRVCEGIDCCEPATYGVDGTRVGKFCMRHAETGMVDVLGESPGIATGVVAADSGPGAYGVGHTDGEPVGVLSRRCSHEGCGEFCSLTGKTVRVRSAALGVTGLHSEKVDPDGGCAFAGCRRQPTHGVEGATAGVRCQRHAEDGMVKLSKFCGFQGCSKAACFGVESDKAPVRCSRHAAADMSCITRKVCAHEGCGVEVVVTGVRGRKRLVCPEHTAVDRAATKKRALCRTAGCKRQPSFGVQDSRVAVSCVEHANDGMVCVKFLPCASQGCGRKASFGVEGTRVGIYCSHHAEECMVDVLSKRCEETDCNKRPSFGFEARAVAVRCSKHADEGMANLVTKRCANQGCSKYAIFGVKGSRVRVYCKKHAEDGMVNVTQKPCTLDRCLQKAMFGLLTDTTPSVCKDHVESLPEGIKFNFKARCDRPNCGGLARYGLEGEEPFLCSEHRTDEHVRLVGTCRSSTRTYSSAMARVGDLSEEMRTKQLQKRKPRRRAVTTTEEVQEVQEAKVGDDVLDADALHKVKLETDIAMQF